MTNKENVCLPNINGVLSFNDDNSTKIVSFCEYEKKNTYDINLYNLKDGKSEKINISKEGKQ